ncbi:GreA/GreB family elongation factor [Euryhalocaulis caribicus]|uniref:GreA/GreB family elongation factor n=1 Tax=Euryhalocaulis caribicus TaxID=1161401 RepID=UPI0003B392FA|nr:GreA/GreB family elongation factor [Euryhalocaulis caribicus]
MAKKFVTTNGMNLLNQKLQETLAAARKVSKEVGEAAGSSYDWHDNFEYEDAQRRLAQVDRQIADLKDILAECQIIEPENQSERIQIGNIVSIAIDDDEKKLTLVGHGESAPQLGLLAYDTPLGAALVGREVGDTFEVMIGRNNREIEILRIFPPPESTN